MQQKYPPTQLCKDCSPALRFQEHQIRAKDFTDRVSHYVITTLHILAHNLRGGKVLETCVPFVGESCLEAQGKSFFSQSPSRHEKLTPLDWSKPFPSLKHFLELEPIFPPEYLHHSCGWQKPKVERGYVKFNMMWLKKQYIFSECLDTWLDTMGKIKILSHLTI